MYAYLSAISAPVLALKLRNGFYQIWYLKSLSEMNYVLSSAFMNLLVMFNCAEHLYVIKIFNLEHF
jgi:hypothetical protein